MIYGIYILIGIFLLCIIGFWLTLRFYKKKKRIAKFQRSPPEEVLEEFNYAEQQMKGGIKSDGTTTSPYQILWDISKKRRFGKPITNTSGTEQANPNGELYTESFGRQDIQDRTFTKPIEDKPVIRKYKPNNFRRIISRARGTN